MKSTRIPVSRLNCPNTLRSIANSRCVAGPQPMNVMTDGVAGLSPAVRLQPAQNRKISRKDEKSRCFARVLTFVVMASPRSSRQRQTLYPTMVAPSLSMLTPAGLSAIPFKIAAGSGAMHAVSGSRLTWSSLIEVLCFWTRFLPATDYFRDRAIALVYSNVGVCMAIGVGIGNVDAAECLTSDYTRALGGWPVDRFKQ